MTLTACDIPWDKTSTAKIIPMPTRRCALNLTPASSIKIRPVHWLWEDRLPMGALTLLGGREGIGKSLTAYTLAGDITRGRLPGTHHGQSKGVLVAATEDSWAHTIVPRLMAANADLNRIYRVDVETTEKADAAELSLPRDLEAMKDAIAQVDAARHAPAVADGAAHAVTPDETHGPDRARFPQLIPGLGG